MWKRFYLVILCLSGPILSKSDHVAEIMIDNVFRRLELNLDYVSQHYDKINVDCLFGVVLGGAILHDSLTQPGPYREKVEHLKEKIDNIYVKALPTAQKHPSWDMLTKYIVVPDLWPKPIKYKLAQFRTAYPKESRVDAIFAEEPKNMNYSQESLSDSCLTIVVNSTLELKPQANCGLNSVCEAFMEKLDSGVGYFLTHKLLLLQLARARRCKMHPKILSAAIKKVCYAVYADSISLDYYVGIDQAFDLVVEQILLCGFEGFADFLKRDWLETIFVTQYKSGCFPVVDPGRKKREVNVWEDGCADHTTGLGAGVLSLYLHYLLKNADTVSLIPGWD